MSRHQKVFPAILYLALGFVSVALSSLMVWQTKNLQYYSYYQLCSFATVVDDFQYGGGVDSYWIGAQNLTNGLFLFHDDYTKAQDAYLANFGPTYNASWLEDDLSLIDGQVTALNTDYLDAKAANFEDVATAANTVSELAYFVDGTWGPTSLPSTTVNTLNQTIYDSIGERMSALTTILAVAQSYTNPNAIGLAAQQSAVIAQAWQNQSTRFLDGMIRARNFYPPYFTTVFVLQGITLTLLVLSLVFVAMVLATESRSWKNVSHISWINGIMVVTISIFNSSIYSMNIIFSTDICGSMNLIKTTETLG